MTTAKVLVVLAGLSYLGVAGAMFLSDDLLMQAGAFALSALLSLLALVMQPFPGEH